MNLRDRRGKACWWDEAVHTTDEPGPTRNAAYKGGASETGGELATAIVADLGGGNNTVHQWDKQVSPIETVSNRFS